MLVDDGAALEQVADLLGDDPRTLLRHYRHQIRPVASPANRDAGGTRLTDALDASEILGDGDGTVEIVRVGQLNRLP